MTATPRIYADSAKALAEKENAALCSIDDPTKYGETLHTITFSEAVAQGLLVDYKVIVLAIEESHVNRRLQDLLKNEDNQKKVDDAARIVGCWKALSKQGLTLDGREEDPAAMHNPRYPLELFLRVITVSLETLKIVKALPKLEKEELS